MAIALNYSVKNIWDDAQRTIHIIYQRKSTVQLTSVGLAYVFPNKHNNSIPLYQFILQSSKWNIELCYFVLSALYWYLRLLTYTLRISNSILV